VWSRFVPFVFVGGGEGRREEFEEGPLREKESACDWEVLRIAKLT
jgi:hypothetical protein